MKFQKEDRVAFINENQEGIVVRYTSSGRVIVAIEEGFELEMAEQELVLVKRIAADKIIQPVATTESSVSPGDLNQWPAGQVSLAFMPSANNAVLTGKVLMVLINNSEFELLYTCYATGKDHTYGIGKGTILSGEQKTMATFDRYDLKCHVHFSIEGLLYHPSLIPTSSRISRKVAPSLPEISQTNKDLTGPAAFARITPLWNDTPVSMDDLMSLKDRFNKDSQKQNETSSRSKFRNDAVLIFEKTIDLHIEQLVKNHKGMNNGEMLKIQLEVFSKEMDKGYLENLQRIIFIHGVGNGVLKKEITNLLKNMKGIRFRDADQLKFGYGATEVIFE